ncbi:LysR family transcriptional regulator [Corallococcus llansteffanensis]|uniref:LysR family transcriptional regulator n=1 Tax=Corallococcus llansteffanensis TaxID=2316731 RepID=A0A3A8PPA2_9BACT|nr:LysR family transcriptional regulator [Corallococcus llansteffanensis]RKH56980.1 LysR family transcriptional regulator [Corallococcus llansteffanensis]
MDRFTAMEAFVRVVESGTFTKAADALGRPKTAVTRLIQQLEAQLRVKLLHRTTRRVTVTPEGMTYYQQAVRLLGEVRELESSLAQTRRGPRGRLRVESSGTISRLLIVPALPSFYARYPQLHIELGVSDRVVDLLSDNVDCAIRGGAVKDESLVARHLGDLCYWVCASPRYVERHGMPHHPLELAGASHAVVSYFSSPSGKELPFVLIREGERLEVQGRSLLTLNETNAYLAAGLAGLGVMYAPRFVLEPYVAAGELVPVLEGWHPEPRPLFLVYPPARQPGAGLRVFIDWTMELFASRPSLWRQDG